MNRENSNFGSTILTRTALVGALLLTLGACGGEDSPAPGPGAIQVLPSTQSACKVDTKSDDRGGYSLGAIAATAQGDTVTITHADARYNCASKVALEATVNGNQIVVQEKITNPGELAFCMCDYDLSVQLKGLPAGTYDVSLTDSDGKPAGTAQVTVGAAAGIPVESLQSACKGNGVQGTFTSGKLSATVSGGALVILHEDASYNCAAKVALQATVSGNAILVKEVITNPDEPMARCMCNYDLSAKLQGLAAGSYTIEVRDSDGKTVGLLEIAL